MGDSKARCACNITPRTPQRSARKRIRLLEQAYRADALFDAHRDYPESGYRFCSMEQPRRAIVPCVLTRWPVRWRGSVPAGHRRDVVSEGGLEPPRPLRALAPQASASAIPPPGLAVFGCAARWAVRQDHRQCCRGNAKSPSPGRVVRPRGRSGIRRGSDAGSARAACPPARCRPAGRSAECLRARPDPPRCGGSPPSR